MVADRGREAGHEPRLRCRFAGEDPVQADGLAALEQVTELVGREPLGPDVADRRARSDAGAVGHLDQFGGTAERVGARRPDPDRHRRVRVHDGAGDLVEAVIGDRGAAAVELEDHADDAVRASRACQSVDDEIGFDVVDQTVDRHDVHTTVAGAGVRLRPGGRGSERSEAGNSQQHQRQRGPDPTRPGRVSPDTSGALVGGGTSPPDDGDHGTR